MWEKLEWQLLKQDSLSTLLTYQPSLPGKVSSADLGASYYSAMKPMAAAKRDTLVMSVWQIGQLPRKLWVRSLSYDNSTGTKAGM